MNFKNLCLGTQHFRIALALAVGCYICRVAAAQDDERNLGRQQGLVGGSEVGAEIEDDMAFLSLTPGSNSAAPHY